MNILACLWLTALWLTAPSDESAIGGMARLEKARLAVQRGQTEAGKQELTCLVEEMPYTDAGRQAFALARALHRQRGGALAEADFLLGVASRLAWLAEPGAVSQTAISSRALLAESLVEVGRIRLEEANLADAAVRILSRALPVARRTPWEDDALIWHARALRQASRTTEALACYHELIKTQQAVPYHGMHPSPFYDDALFEVAQLLEEQHRFDEAQLAYSEFFQRTPASELVNQAAERLRSLRARYGALRGPWQAPKAHPLQFTVQ